MEIGGGYSGQIKWQINPIFNDPHIDTLTGRINRAIQIDNITNLKRRDGGVCRVCA
jgi:hypothetical protein